MNLELSRGCLLLSETDHLQFINTLSQSIKRLFILNDSMSPNLALIVFLISLIYFPIPSTKNLSNDILFIISSPTAARQIGPALDASATLVPGTLQSRTFALTLPRLLFMTLPAIDLNDTTKTYGAFKILLWVINLCAYISGYSSGGLDMEIEEARKIV